jgi:hypothetical protein
VLKGEIKALATKILKKDTQNSIALYQFPKKPYTLARFEPTIFCCGGGDNDH